MTASVYARSASRNFGSARPNELTGSTATAWKYLARTPLTSSKVRALVALNGYHLRSHLSCSSYQRSVEHTVSILPYGTDADFYEGYAMSDSAWGCGRVY